MEASMDPQRNDLLGELASDAALERSDFLEAVTGRPQSRAEAARVVAERLAATT